ncbi:hypothetical protein Acsp05_60730 [Actinokineospora sp. NBRC 105648]|nr:hypothetical protein Acsp05_60730 [Actinokineospora sp. NBRC 105648]
MPITKAKGERSRRASASGFWAMHSFGLSVMGRGSHKAALLYPHDGLSAIPSTWRSPIRLGGGCNRPPVWWWLTKACGPRPT